MPKNIESHHYKTNILINSYQNFHFQEECSLPNQKFVMKYSNRKLKKTIYKINK